MDFVVSIVSSAVTEIGKSLCGYYPSIMNFINFKSTISALEKEMESLVDLKSKVIEEVDSSDAQMKQWLREVQQIITEVDSVQADMTAIDEKLCGCFFTCSRRYRFSREMARMLEEVERLLKAGKIAAKMVGQNYMAKAVEHIPGPCIESQATASQTLAKVMDLLNDDGVLRIGVWGMGGVGKTTLVKNLNNKLKSSSSTLRFDIVIWATVSQKLDLKHVQTQIAERLNLEVKKEESEETIARRLRWSLLKEKFLLILDDVWETIDLDSLGVPQPEDHPGSKIILTSRSLEVCREMKTDRLVKVDVLNDEESWQLFTESAGEEATTDDIEPIARQVAKECSGLPLAITIVGKAMRGKTKIELWKVALDELKSSDVPDIKDIENKVFRPLKWSYDSLQGKNIKPCFLYCSLYPEDFSIDVSELVMYWLGEGLIDGRKNYEDSYNKGIALIENLKDSCLLEHGAREGTVKMHDVVRNVAIWISSSSEDGCKALVRSGIGLTRISESEISASLIRASFMHNKITELPDCGVRCPVSSTLLLQDNHHLKRIPEGFLQAFVSLKVLNISGTLIQSLPESILLLIDLVVLILKDCVHLKEIPQVRNLIKLQVLDCSASGIRQLPTEMKNLRKLRQLYLSRTHNLKTIDAGIISALSSLEVLDLTSSGYIWGVKKQHAHATFDELLCLEHLLVISIQLMGIPTLDSRAQTWIGRLRRYQFVTGRQQTTFWQTGLDRKMVTVIKQGLLEVVTNPLLTNPLLTNPLLTNATSLVVDHYEELGNILEIMAVKSNDCFAGLKSLTIANCSVFRLSRDDASKLDSSTDSSSKLDLLPKLEELHLINVALLESISHLIHNLGLSLSRLRIMEVTDCPKLRFLLRYGNPRLNTEKLEVIKVSFCDELYELFQHTRLEIEAAVSVVPKLRMIEVTNCNALRKLPLRDLNPDTIEEIRGDEPWWDKLEQGSDKDTKVRLQKYFKPVRTANIRKLHRCLTGIF